MFNRFILIFVFFFCMQLTPRSSAQFPIAQLAGVSQPFANTEKHFSPIHGVRALESGLIHYYYYYYTNEKNEASNADNLQTLAKALFFKSPLGIEPTVMGSNVAPYLHPGLIGKLIKDMSNNKELPLSQRAQLLTDLLWKDPDFLGAIENYRRIDQSLKAQAQKASDEETKTRLLKEAHKYNPELKVLKRKARQFGRLLLLPDAQVVLQSFLWAKVRHKDELRPYYEAFGITLDEQWSNDRFDEELPAFSQQNQDEQTFTALKISTSRVNLMPYRSATVNDIVFPDCGESALFNTFRIAFHDLNLDELEKLRIYPGISAAFHKFFSTFSTEESQLTQDARNAFARLVSNLNNFPKEGERNSLENPDELEPHPVEYRIKRDELQCELSAAKNPALSIKNAIYKLTGAPSLEDFSKIVKSVTNKSIAFKESLNPNGQGIIEISKEGLGTYIWEFKQRHFSIRPILDPALEAEIEAQQSLAYSQGDYVLFGIYPNTASKLAKLSKLLATSREADQNNVEKTTMLLAPITNDDDALRVIEHFSKSKVWPEHFAQKLFHRLATADAKAQFLYKIKPEQRLPFATSFLIDSYDPKESDDPRSCRLRDEYADLFRNGFLRNGHSLIRALIVNAGLCPSLWRDWIAPNKNLDLDLLSEIADYPHLSDPVLEIFRKAAQTMQFGKSRMNSNGYPREKDSAYYYMLTSSRLEKNGYESTLGYIKTLEERMRSADKSVVKTLAQPAARAGSVTLLDLSIKLGADPNHSKRDNQAPLFWAIEEDRMEAVNYLLNLRSADLNITTEFDKETPLIVAIRNLKFEIAKKILDRGASHVQINKKDRSGAGALHYAVLTGDIELVRKCLSFKNLDINATLKDGSTALHSAVSADKPELLELLMSDRRIGLNVLNAVGLTPLGLAKSKAAEKISSILASRNAQETLSGFFSKKAQLRSLIFHAATVGDLNLLDQCIKSGVSPRIQGLTGNTPLHAAIISLNNTVVEKLLALKKTDVNSKNKEDESPLYVAIANNNLEALRLLKEHPSIDLNQKLDTTWNSALSLAARMDDLDSVRILMEAPHHAKSKSLRISNPRHRDSPPHIAVHYASLEMVKLLLQIPGADLFHRNLNSRNVFGELLGQRFSYATEINEDQAEFIRVLLYHVLKTAPQQLPTQLSTEHIAAMGPDELLKIGHTMEEIDPKIGDLSSKAWWRIRCNG